MLINTAECESRDWGLGTVGDGEMGRWGDGEMGRWGGGEMGRWRGEEKVILLSPHPLIPPSSSPCPMPNAQ